MHNKEYSNLKSGPAQDAAAPTEALSETAVPISSAGTPEKRPARYNLYDKMKLNISERAINAVIIVITLLILAAVFYGIFS